MTHTDSKDTLPESRAISSPTAISTLTDQGHLFIFSYSLKDRALVSWSKNALELLGVPDSEVARQGDLFLRHVHSDDRFRLLNDLERALRGEEEYRATYRWIRPDNDELRWLHCRAAITKGAPDSPDTDLFEGILLDLSSEYLAAGGKLGGGDASNSILGALEEIIFTLDEDLRFQITNKLESLLNFNFGDPAFNTEELKAGREFLSCFGTPELRSSFELIFEQILNGEIPIYHSRIKSHDRIYSLSLTPRYDEGAIIGIVGTLVDATTRAALEERVAELRKGESLRALASGAAHNLKNSLQTLAGYASTIKAHPENLPMVTQAASSILETVTKASELTQHLLSLDSANKELLGSVDINLSTMTALSKLTPLYSEKFPSANTIFSVIFGNPGQIAAREKDLTQAIESLISLICESQSEGEILINTFQVSLSESQHGNLPQGVYAKLKLSKLTPSTVTRFRELLSDPSSLSTSPLRSPLATIREFHGDIVAEADPLGIALYLPVIKSEAESLLNKIEIEPVPEVSPQILLVDDDRMILETVCALLTEEGYRCVTAETSAEALSAARAHQQTMKLALVDAVMPGMDSPMLVRRLGKLNPNLKIVIFSGATPEYTGPLLEAGAISIIQKPVDPKKLSVIIREMVGDAAEQKVDESPFQPNP